MNLTLEDFFCLMVANFTFPRLSILSRLFYTVANIDVFLIQRKKVEASVAPLVSAVDTCGGNL